MQYLVSLSDKHITSILNEYVFTKEEEIQEILEKNPEIVLDIPEIDVEGNPHAMACREFPTRNGPIDVLYLTTIGEIIIVETKLIKNPEATRTVVAQVIDYIKGLSAYQVDDFLRRFEERISNKTSMHRGDKFRHQVSESLRTGYFKAVILGDFINPSILGMVESIQAAPHLAFSILLVEANARKLNDEILISPRVISNTVQVERSVIRLEINLPQDKYTISSEIPIKDREGNKPKKTWDEYIETVTPQEFAIIIDNFKKDWENDFPNSVNMGTVGFSTGVILGNTRIPIQFVYDNRLGIITRSQVDKYNISDSMFDDYKEELKAISKVYDEYVVGGKTTLPFAKLNTDELLVIFTAAKNIGKRLIEQK